MTRVPQNPGVVKSQTVVRQRGSFAKLRRDFAEPKGVLWNQRENTYLWRNRVFCKTERGFVKRNKLKWYGHVSHLSGLAKTILQGTVKGGRRQGRQKKRWEDNIMEWTGLEFAKSQKAVEKNGGNWL